MIELNEVGYKLLIILTIYAALLIFYILYLYLKEPFNCDELGLLLMMGIVFFYDAVSISDKRDSGQASRYAGT